MNNLLVKLTHMVSDLMLHLAEVKTDNGVLISKSEIEVGSEVFIKDENGEIDDAPDGEYKAEDEKIFVVADGKVAEIRELEPEEAPMEEQPEEPVEEEQEEQEPEQPTEEATAEDEKDKRIAELEAQVAELNQVIVEKDELIGELRKQLEESDAKPAEEQLKSQEPERKTWFKARY